MIDASEGGDGEEGDEMRASRSDGYTSDSVRRLALMMMSRTAAAIRQYVHKMYASHVPLVIMVCVFLVSVTQVKWTRKHISRKLP